jgi:hypothetical protein
MPKPSSAPPSFETVRQLALSLPGVEEGLSYGTPAFRVAKKFMARLREDLEGEGQVLVIKLDIGHSEALIDADPATFFITDHYRGYPAVLIRIARAHPKQLRELLEESWRRATFKKPSKSRPF